MKEQIYENEGLLLKICMIHFFINGFLITIFYQKPYLEEI